MDDLQRAELRMPIGYRVTLVVEEAASKTFEHIGVVPVGPYTCIPERCSEDD